MGGLSIEKIMIIAVIAVVILGPQRLPYYASQLAKGVKWARGMIQNAQDRMREEMGEEFDEVDWKKLDPRQYDPRRIIREALVDEVLPAGPSDPSAAKPVSAQPVAAQPYRESAYEQRQRKLGKGRPAPFDLEST